MRRNDNLKWQCLPRFLLASVLAVGAAYACGPAEDPALDRLVADADGRLRAAIQQREEAQADSADLAATDAAFAELAAAARRAVEPPAVAADPPSAEEESEGPRQRAVNPATAHPRTTAPPSRAEAGERVRRGEVDASAAQAALADLIRLREELTLRGSVDSYRAQAEAEWELATWKGIVERTRGGGGFPPDNELALLPAAALDELIARWDAKRRGMERMAALAPELTSRVAIDECTAKLRRLREALVEPVLRPPTLRRARDAIDDVEEWVGRRQEQREAAIARREANLLRQAVARAPQDVAARIRLASFDGGSNTALDTFRFVHRKSARDLTFALSPRPGPAEDGAAGFLRSLVADPLAAARHEAFLDGTFQELAVTKEAEVRDRLLPSRVRGDREAWIVSLLSDPELEQARLLFDETVRRLRTLMVEETAPEPTNLPREHLERYAERIRAELAYRRGGDGADERPVRSAVLSRLAEARPETFLATPEGEEREWQALRRYGAAGLAGSELQARMEMLAVSGFGREIKLLEGEATRLHELRLRLTREGLPTIAGAAGALGTAGGALREKVAILRRGIDTAAGSGEEAVDLKRRLGDVVWILGPGGDSPPGAGGPAPDRRPTPTAPFLDGRLRTASSIFKQQLARLRDLERAEPAPPVRLATFALEADPVLQVRTAQRSRPEAAGWRIDGKRVSYADINSLRSLDILPGGVALGQVATVEGQLMGFGLVYDAERRRLVLRNREGETLVLPAEDPEVLKACYLFARESDPVAVSIGITGEAGEDRGAGREARRVTIHPELRDTRVGLHAIQADRLPWSLEDRVLPNGARNPVATTMQPLIERVREETLGSLPAQRVLQELVRLGVSLRPEARDTWLPTIRTMSRSNSPLDLMIQAVADADTFQQRARVFAAKEDSMIRATLRKEGFFPEPSTGSGLGATTNPADSLHREIEARIDAQLEALREEPEFRRRRTAIGEQLGRLSPDRAVALAQLGTLGFRDDTEHSWMEAARLLLMYALLSEESFEAEDLARQVLLIIQSRQLSLLTDGKIAWQRESDTLEPSSVLRVRYVRGRLEAGKDGFRRSEAAVDHRAASEAATAALPRLEAAFPALRSTREHAAWIALFRWALDDGKLAWVDLADLSGVEHRTVITPDFLCPEGSAARCKQVIEGEN